jgi:hypothetical protein
MENTVYIFKIFFGWIRHHQNAVMARTEEYKERVIVIKAWPFFYNYSAQTDRFFQK